MKTLTSTLLLFTCLTLLSGCAITHKYGPYMGKVVEKETGEPIEGAVVFVRFLTEFGFSPGGGVSDYADAMEVLTDDKGEYLLPAHRIFTFKIGHFWNKQVHTIIFKPGYGAYPGHPKSTSGKSPDGWLHAKEYDIIKLPKLITREERRENIYNASRYSRDEVPCIKQHNILKLYDSESIFVGLKPLNFCE